MLNSLISRASQAAKGMSCRPIGLVHNRFVNMAHQSLII